MGLADLCDALHRFNVEHDVARIMSEMYVELPEPVMTPAEAYDRLVQGKVERVAIDALNGRVAATMIVPYPPGIPTIMPGERYGGSNRAILDSLNLAREQNERFPGFESDVHGLIVELDEEGKEHYVVEVLVQEA